jgi:hypothetical protein
LSEQKAAEEKKLIDEQQRMQARRRGQRYGGMRSLLSSRENAETGVKKTTLG